MPIPKPAAGESRDEFISRCMGDSVMVGEYPKDQRYAICSHTWGKKYNVALLPGVMVNAFNPAQPRDEKGRWTDSDSLFSAWNRMETPAGGDDDFQVWAKGLTREQLRALDEWETSIMIPHDIRARLNGKKPIYVTEQSIDRTIGILSEAFLAAPRYEGTVYRGHKGAVKVKVGDRMSFDSFASTTKEQAVAEHYAVIKYGMDGPFPTFKEWGKTKTVFRINSKTGVDITKASSLEDQKEVVMPHGAEFDVTAISTKQVLVNGKAYKVTYIDLDESYDY